MFASYAIRLDDRRFIYRLKDHEKPCLFKNCQTYGLL